MNKYDKLQREIKKFLKEYPGVLKEFENLFTRNRIFMDRTIGCGPIAAERALNYGFTGPNLRAAGVDYDVRVHTPYSSYEDFDFIIPVYQTTKQVKQKVNKMQQDMNEHIQKQSNNPYTANTRQETAPGTKKNEDYIDFEEVK